ncbi:MULTISPECIES: type II secretion system protein N [unclassified Oceanobacter]|jgi:general secretion pathway protein N|uniref:type II secretion system protein N n=1 Tax=unclassified Oceanobacter TaxID=2620260 RepID=UPI0026E46F7F|nr:MULTISPECIES: type II secretion system protein N [unclassified Oceanobacter]MDO6681658.1 type II secretion system protein N [Oceanobacter sp. 5_MG-2023]MDP2505714.1 type II secretion system protein N [Oceanobacter sp. 3_MG-2023]MDP2547459.1 type II secretion system protein N [Oceanobacter sp. 4_MG-2023]MDP2608247.1 type II secretion system protein N [Oceanobacter sp. 1_MG-2023]MDP2612132.1 type II secretion system protein N [Oceanobacter sp. 2_MG-2023]
MFSAIWAARWYLLLGLFAFLIFLVVNAPLHFVWRMLEPELKNLPVDVRSVSGTIWHGQVQAEQRDLGLLDAEWRLSPASLLVAAPEVDLTLTSPFVRLQGLARLGADQALHIRGLDGFLDTELLRPLLRPSRVELSGNIEASDLSAVIHLDTRVISALDGRLVFGGGSAVFPVQRKRISADVPMLVGQLGMTQEQAVLDVTTVEGQPLVQGFVQPDGWAGVAVRRRMIDVLGQTWPDKAEVDTVIFEVSRKIL